MGNSIYFAVSDERTIIGSRLILCQERRLLHKCLFTTVSLNFIAQCPAGTTAALTSDKKCPLCRFCSSLSGSSTFTLLHRERKRGRHRRCLISFLGNSGYAHFAFCPERCLFKWWMSDCVCLSLFAVNTKALGMRPPRQRGRVGWGARFCRNTPEKCSTICNTKKWKQLSCKGAHKKFFVPPFEFFNRQIYIFLYRLVLILNTWIHKFIEFAYKLKSKLLFVAVLFSEFTSVITYYISQYLVLKIVYFQYQ